MVETAAGVVEEVGKRVVGTAAVILEKAGVDVAEVERRLGGQFPPSAKTLQTMAEEAFTAGRAGVDLAVGVARNEAEKVFERVGDQVTKVGVVLAYLETKLREVEEEAPAAQTGPGAYDAREPVPAPRADDLFGRGWEFEDEPSTGRTAGEPIVAERVEVDEPVEVDPPVAPAAPVPSVSPVSPAVSGETEAAEEPTAEEPTAGRPTAKKAAAKKAPAKKTPAKKTPARKTAEKTTVAKPAAPKPAAAKKTTAKKTTVKKTATAKQAADQPKAPAKRTATRKTTVRKATSTRKKPDVRDE
ncbi:hypothetical protein [Streptomyces sp. NRRL S-350]|uniref:hypothetical protein n=1 Tax=Streptomyces sp. NRRL S-350 TaxID=1463902 RepID=UPI00068A9C25|nr:hypothetical protein [Streptomyces sp. NRRL S-350]